ncbi:unnamed protein product [Taenia asiatica]|uniref:DSPc domain-containing protein n=1 Tax=Taenia asiatica TaxID=60517 RepID=A0A3P6NGV2_TAEAS|nr:unnamed protein product [Taenia asiatica]
MDIVHNFLYLLLPVHTLPKFVIENLHITAKIACYPKALERYSSTQMNRGGRVVIMTNEYNRVGSTLAMAYLIAGEGKSLKEAWATLRRAYLALRPRWEFLDRLAVFEQKVRNLPDPIKIADEDFL